VTPCWSKADSNSGSHPPVPVGNGNLHSAEKRRSETCPILPGDRGFESISLQEGVRCEPDLLDHGYIPDVLGGIEPSLVMPPELVIPPELVAEVTYLTWAAASVLRMVY